MYDTEPYKRVDYLQLENGTSYIPEFKFALMDLYYNKRIDVSELTLTELDELYRQEHRYRIELNIETAGAMISIAQNIGKNAAKEVAVRRNVANTLDDSVDDVVEGINNPNPYDLLDEHNIPTTLDEIDRKILDN